MYILAHINASGPLISGNHAFICMSTHVKIYVHTYIHTCILAQIKPSSLFISRKHAWCVRMYLCMYVCVHSFVCTNTLCTCACVPRMWIHISTYRCAMHSYANINLSLIAGVCVCMYVYIYIYIYIYIYMLCIEACTSCTRTHSYMYNHKQHTFPTQAGHVLTCSETIFTY